jgi:hypothetical protein
LKGKPAMPDWLDETWGPLLSLGDSRPDTCWRDRHGPVTRYWSGETLIWIEGVRLPNGSRTTASAPASIRPTARIPNPGKHGFTHGVINWEPDDIAFVPLPRNPVHHVGELLQPILNRMLESRELVELVRAEFHHGVALNSLLFNCALKHQDGSHIQFGLRLLGALVAALRDIGEDYLDFYLDDDTEAYDRGLEVLPAMRKAVESAGFTIYGP